MGSLWEEQEIPADLLPKAQEYRDKLIEAVVELDDKCAIPSAAPFCVNSEHAAV